MTRTQYLLLLVMEECGEVAHECSKAMRFGLDEVQPGQSVEQALNNAQRIAAELTDLYAVLELLEKETGLAVFDHLFDPKHSEVQAKRDKVATYMKKSRDLGQLGGTSL